jgi:hypothetical protein
VKLQQKVRALSQLGDYLKDFIDGKQSLSNNELFDQYYEKTIHAIAYAERKNPWFTQKNIMHALSYWANQLNEEKLNHWLANYQIAENITPKKVGVIMAGNIPMVGFHDLLGVFLSGHQFNGKLSSDDQILIPHLIEVLAAIAPEAKNDILFSEQFLKNMDAYIGTGSNNSARYFEYYFRDKPHIIRNNRNGVAVLTGKETPQDFEKLGEDIFRYFGLGCRNVSKLYVPTDYNFNVFFEGIYPFFEMVNHNKYGNNYEYNRTVYLMGNEKLLDNNFLIIKEDKGLSSPIAVLFYEYYENVESLNNHFNENAKVLQCVIANDNKVNNAIPFGNSQHPALYEYADGFDTMRFLLDLTK